MATFDLPLKGMPNGTQEFEYELGMDFFRKKESTDVLSGDVKVRVEVKRSGDIYELNFTLKGEIGIPCDRCLDEMRHAVDAEYRVNVKYGDEYNDEADNVIEIPENFSTFDVSSLIYDTIMLTIPLKHTHAEGECNAEMQAQLAAHKAVNILDDEMEWGDGEYAAYPDDDGQDTAATNDENDDFSCDPRWEALKKLKDNNN